MPYQQRRGLPAERASRLGHLAVLKSTLVNSLCETFESASQPATSTPGLIWTPLPTTGMPGRIIFGVDGSLQVVTSDHPPRKELAFVKTALLRLDPYKLAKINPRFPHPLEMRDLMTDTALYHATAIPLRHIRGPGMTLYDTVRKLIFDSLADPSLEGEPLETFRWIVYEKWSGIQRGLPPFQCPHCAEIVATLPYDALMGSCPGCGGEIYVTDMAGFHQDMAEDAAPIKVASAYMLLHEMLLLFTAVRHFWEKHRQQVGTCLFVKDGPLTIGAQYGKLVEPLRRFLAHAQAHGYSIHMIGQEKTGQFADHLEMIAPDAPDNSFFIPTEDYITQEIQCRPDRRIPYGVQTNFGAKVFVKLSLRHALVLSIPTGLYVKDPQPNNLIGFADICATLPQTISHRYDGALVPIELAHNVASLSTYPSARMLKIFAEQSHAAL